MKQQLTLFSDTFIWLKEVDGMLYNTLDATKIEFKISDSIKKICNHLLDENNLYTIIFDTSDLDDSATLFYNLIIDRKYGFMTEINTPVVSLLPKAKIQYNIDYLKSIKESGKNIDLMHYLRTLTIYIGGPFIKRNSFSNQTIYPVDSTRKLNIDLVVNYVNRLNTANLQKINIVVSDFDSDIIKISEKIINNKDAIVFYIHAIDAIHKSSEIKKLVALNYFIVLIIEPTEINNDFENIIFTNNKVSYNILVRSNDECAVWDKFSEKYNIDSYNLIPLFDNNFDFFKENVLLTKDDIRKSKLSRTEIYAHQTINITNFGSLTLMPDEKIYSSIDTDSLGTIYDSLNDIIFKELENNYSWRQIRNTHKCNSCIYQWLCPSPSTYEKVLQINCICIDN